MHIRLTILLKTTAEIESSRREYEALPSAEWRKDYFNEENGGFVATHKYKKRDYISRPGIVAEVKACLKLASIGKHILRLPENIPELIDNIIIDGMTYRNLLKFKPNETKPRGYPDAYFDGQTWDFKTSTYKNDDTLRQTIKDGRKANNLIFIVQEKRHITKIQRAMDREVGKRLADNSWLELPDIYCFLGDQLIAVWKKQ